MLGPAHEFLVLIAYAQTLHFNAFADVSSSARGLKFCLRFHLYPYFVYTSTKGSDESAHLRRLPELWLLNNAIRTKLSCVGPFNYVDS